MLLAVNKPVKRSGEPDNKRNGFIYQRTFDPNRRLAPERLGTL